MRDDITQAIGDLIFYGAFYSAKNDFVEELLEDIKSEMEKRIGSSLEWEEIEHHQIEKDICNRENIAYLYNDKEIANIFKSIKFKDSFNEVYINFDIEDFKKRYLKDFFSDEFYLEYINKEKMKKYLDEKKAINNEHEQQGELGLF